MFDNCETLKLVGHDGEESPQNDDENFWKGEGGNVGTTGIPELAGRPANGHMPTWVLRFANARLPCLPLDSSHST